MHVRMQLVKPHGVAPREGAGIEISVKGTSISGRCVAPREGAWIEIRYRDKGRILQWSRPVRARGLKLYAPSEIDGTLKSRPVRARGLKYRGDTPTHDTERRAPMRGAWIEIPRRLYTDARCKSRPHAGRVD